MTFEEKCRKEVYQTWWTLLDQALQQLESDPAAASIKIRRVKEAIARLEL